MRALGLALFSVLAITPPIAVQASGPASNMRPANAGTPSNIVWAWDGSGSGGHAGVIAGHRPNGARRMEWTRGCPALGAKPLLRRVLLLWRAAGADLLGLGSWERRIRLSFRGLARPHRRVG